MSANLGSLEQRAMLASLEISMWTARRFDRKASQEVADKHSVDVNMGRYNKGLLPKDAHGKPADELQAVISAAGQARIVHYKQSLPWRDDGARILPAANYLSWSSAMASARDEFNIAVSAFVTAYPNLKSNAALFLNGLYNAMDYPATNDIAGKFAFNTYALPLPTAADFRVDLGDNLVTEIKNDITSRIAESIAGTTKDLYSRIGSVLERVANLSNRESRVKPALARDVDDLIGLLSRLNIANDPGIENARAMLAQSIAFEPKELQGHQRRKNAIAAKATTMLNDLAPFMSQE